MFGIWDTSGWLTDININKDIHYSNECVKYTYIYVYIHMYMYIYMYIYICVYIYAQHVCVCVYRP